MINLLPPDQAMHIRYGRRNVRLQLWLFGMVIAIAGLLVVVSAGSIYLDKQSKNYQKDIDATNQQLKAQNLTKVQSDADELSGDVKVINQVLSQEINFSDLIQAIGQVMPSGTVLGSLSLSKTSGSIDLNANTIDPPSAAQVAINLSDPNKDLFSKVDVVGVNCSSDKTSQYKCSATYRALFSKKAPTKFLNVPKGNTP
jgi:Tfp pilus assembly protein PilN